ncbi:MAG: hypothetical protein WDM89_03065 [Rhizomicrobium sp.]
MAIRDEVWAAPETGFLFACERNQSWINAADKADNAIPATATPAKTGATNINPATNGANTMATHFHHGPQSSRAGCSHEGLAR